VLAAGAGPAAAGQWGKPFRLAPQYSTDLTPAVLSMSSRGNAAAAFSVQNEDTPSVSSADLVIRAARGGVSEPFAVPRSQAVLDLAYDRSGLRLLTGTSESGNQCCSTVQTLSLLRNGRFGRPSTLVGKLVGATIGSLTPLPSGRLLATVASDRGVWVAQSSPGGGFGPTHRLTSAAAMPWIAAATADARGRTAVAWAETKGQQGEIAPNTVYAATGSETAVPARSHPAFTLAAGHAVDEIGLAPASSGATAAWVESWFDRRGSYHADVVVSDLASGSRRRVFSVSGEAASGLSVAGDPRGDQIVAWKSCARSGSCTVRTAVRRGGGAFGPAQRLGAIDPGQSPAAGLSPGGDALVGWIASGHVYAAAGRAGRGGLGPARTVSSTNYASNLALAFGGSGTALAAWTQGTLAPDVVGSVFNAR
jgi:hypothetical protein